MVKKQYGLLGWQIQHSLSPAMHNAAFAADQVPAYYQLYDVVPADIQKMWVQLEQHQLLAGLNVTTPYKNWVFNELVANGLYLDQPAQLSQSVNTLVRTANGEWQGYSTDGLGFWQSVQSQSPKSVLLVGMGGAARAIIVTKPAQVELTVASRLSRRFTAHADFVAAHKLGPLLSLNQVETVLPQVDLVVDATTVGIGKQQSILSSDQLKKTPEQAHMIDLKYQYAVTPFMKAGLAANRHVENGLSMLIEQGRLSYALWQGYLPTKSVFKMAIQREHQQGD